MRRTLAMLALFALVGCREPRHLWSLDMGNIALETAVFSILEARAAPAEAQPHPDEGETENDDTEERREADAGQPESTTAERATQPPAAPEEVEPPAYQEETAEELPRSDDELTADTDEPGEDEDVEPSEEEQVEAEVAAEQHEQARRLQAMQAELLAVEEQLRQQYDVNVAVAAELIVHTHRFIYTQLLIAALLDRELRR